MLGPCSQLLYLDLSGHALSGALPALPQGLQFLNLSSNGLSQRLPQLASSPSLQYIDLSFNRCGQRGGCECAADVVRCACLSLLG